MSEKGHNIVKIPNPANFDFKIHDFHCHMHEDLGKNQDKYGVKSMCIMPSWKTLKTVDFMKNPPNNFTEADGYQEKVQNIENSSIMKGWTGKIYKFLPVDFSKSPEEFTEYVQKDKIAGIKLHPLQNFKIDKETLDPFINLAIEKDLMLYIHTDWIPSTEWKQVKNRMPETFNKIAEMYPEITIIMGHAGFNDSYVNIWKIIKKFPNVVAETSFAPTPQELEKVIYKVNPEKLVFGSSFPLSSTAGEILKIMKMHRVTEEQKKAVLYDNAMKLLKNKPYIEIKNGKEVKK